MKPFYRIDQDTGRAVELTSATLRYVDRLGYRYRQLSDESGRSTRNAMLHQVMLAYGDAALHFPYEVMATADFQLLVFYASIFEKSLC